MTTRWQGFARERSFRNLTNRLSGEERKDEQGKNEVRVGSTLHPMEENHYIMFIETITPDYNRAELQYLHPGEEAKMLIGEKLGKELAREFCSIHGLWEGKSD